MVKVGHQLPSSILCLISFGDKGKIVFAFRTPSILSKINQFNQTMPTLVLDLESSSIFIIIISLFGNNWWCPCNETAWSLYPKKAFANSRPKWWHQWKLVGDIFSSRVIASKMSSRNYSIPCEFFPGAKLCVWYCIALCILELNSSQVHVGRINWREWEFSLWAFGHLK